jgi:hypothetical protein
MSTPAPSDADAPRRSAAPLLACLAVCAVVLCLFAPVLRFGFVTMDDPENVYENPHLTAPGMLGFFWRGPYNNLYTPITYSLWAMVAARSGGPQGLDAAGFHGLGLGFHVLNVALVFALLRRLFGRRADLPAAAGALLFGVHPLQTDSVAWVTGNNNLFGAFFSLLTLHGYVAWAGVDAEQAEADERSGQRPLLLVGATACYVLALLAKPTAACVPLVAAALHVGRPVPLRRVAWLLAVWLGLAAVDALVTRAVSHGMARGVTYPLWARPFVIGDALAFYLGKLAFPAVLSVEYGRGLKAVIGNWWGYATWVVPVAVGALLWRVRRRPLGAWAGVAALVFVAALLPVIGLVPYYYLPIGTVANRYVYFAMLGPAILATAALCRAQASARWRTAWLATTGAVLVALAARTAAYLPTWRDTEAMARGMIAAAPGNFRGWNDLGNALTRRGDTAGGEAAYKEALRLNPTSYPARYNYAMALGRRGDHGAAADLFAQLLAEDIRDGEPDTEDLRATLGMALSRAGRHDEAVKTLEDGLAAYPRSVGLRVQLGLALVRAGRADKAIPVLEEAARIAPADPGPARALAAARHAPAKPK